MVFPRPVAVFDKLISLFYKGRYFFSGNSLAVRTAAVNSCRNIGRIHNSRRVRHCKYIIYLRAFKLFIYGYDHADARRYRKVRQRPFIAVFAHYGDFLSRKSPAVEINRKSLNVFEQRRIGYVPVIAVFFLDDKRVVFSIEIRACFKQFPYGTQISYVIYKRHFSFSRSEIFSAKRRCLFAETLCEKRSVKCFFDLI